MQTTLVSVFMVLGAAFILIAAIGIVRFREFFSRMHATTKATSFGVLLLLIGVTLFFEGWVIGVKALLIVFFIYLTAPLSAHSIAKSLGKNKNRK